MKKLLVLIGFVLFLTVNAAKAFTIDVQPTLININGTFIYRSSIKRIDYSSMDGTTYIYLKDGNVLSFYTDYNEYSEINRAYHTVSVSQHTYITPYYGYYQGYYPTPDSVVYSSPIPSPVISGHSYTVYNQPKESTNGFPGSPNKLPVGQSYSSGSSIPAAPAPSAYNQVSFPSSHRGCQGGGAMVPQYRGAHGGAYMGS